MDWQTDCGSSQTPERLWHRPTPRELNANLGRYCCKVPLSSASRLPPPTSHGPCLCPTVAFTPSVATDVANPRVFALDNLFGRGHRVPMSPGFKHEEPIFWAHTHRHVNLDNQINMHTCASLPCMQPHNSIPNFAWGRASKRGYAHPQQTYYGTFQHRGTTMSGLFLCGIQRIAFLLYSSPPQ